MIWTPLTTIMVVLGFFALGLLIYATPKALHIWRKVEKASLEERYALEKSFYLLSTVVWVVLISRLVAMALFWATNESLIPLIPGAMCQFGVNQAGAPFSWIDNGVKLIVIFVYGFWLIVDWINRRCKGSPLMATLSRNFLMLVPLLAIDSLLDLAFYFKVEPVVVPCCRTTFTPEVPVPCPYCFIFHDAPMFIVVIVGYGLALATVTWSFAIRKYALQPGELGQVGMRVLRGLVTLSLAFAIIGTVALVPAIFQVMAPAAPLH